MKFSQRSEVGVRLLIDLARRRGDGPASLNEVARIEGLSQPFLEQVIIPLRKAGFVRSYQGMRGGYELARAPEEIGMGEVLRVLEGSLAPMFCVSTELDRDVCALEESCGTRVLWGRVRDGIVDALDKTTLAELMIDEGDAAAAASPAALAAIVPVATVGPDGCADYQAS